MATNKHYGWVVYSVCKDHLIVAQENYISHETLFICLKVNGKHYVQATIRQSHSSFYQISSFLEHNSLLSLQVTIQPLRTHDYSVTLWWCHQLKWLHYVNNASTLPL